LPRENVGKFMYAVVEATRSVNHCIIIPSKIVKCTVNPALKNRHHMHLIWYTHLLLNQQSVPAMSTNWFREYLLLENNLVAVVSYNLQEITICRSRRLVERDRTAQWAHTTSICLKYQLLLDNLFNQSQAQISSCYAKKSLANRIVFWLTNELMPSNSTINELEIFTVWCCFVPRCAFQLALVSTMRVSWT